VKTFFLISTDYCLLSAKLTGFGLVIPSCLFVVVLVGEVSLEIKLGAEW